MGKSNSNGAGNTWSAATRDMVVTSINKGQLPILGVLAIVLSVAWRLPEDRLAKLVEDIFASLNSGELIGYTLFVVTLIAWYFHSRYMRKTFSKEYERIGKEKSNLQSSAAGVKFPSSDR